MHARSKSAARSRSPKSKFAAPTAPSSPPAASPSSWGNRRALAREQTQSGHREAAAQRPEQKPFQAENRHTAENGEKHQQVGQAQATARRQRAQDVVDAADHDGAPREQTDALPGVTGREQHDADGNPDQAGAD